MATRYSQKSDTEESAVGGNEQRKIGDPTSGESSESSGMLREEPNSTYAPTPRIVSREGKGIVLEVDSVGGFQLRISDEVGEIYVPEGDEFFRTVSRSKPPTPYGVRIKVRNNRGEILTLSQSSGPDGWYSPPGVSSQAIYHSSKPKMERITEAQRTATFKISNMTTTMPANLKNQEDLEFKIKVNHFLLNLARDADGQPLGLEDFPEIETKWLDGKLLFSGE